MLIESRVLLDCNHGHQVLPRQQVLPQMLHFPPVEFPTQDLVVLLQQKYEPDAAATPKVPEDAPSPEALDATGAVMVVTCVLRSGCSVRMSCTSSMA